jgi:hypothetical protein
VEQIRNKPIKVLHIFPNPKQIQTNSIQNLKQALSNDEFEKLMNKAVLQVDEVSVDKLSQIKRRDIKKEELYLHMPEIVENMFNKAKEDIQDKKLYLQSHGMIEQHGKVFDLNFNSIREKYINFNSQIILDNKELGGMNSKAKFQNINKATKLDILNNEKYEFPFLDIDLTKEILIEANKPIEVPLEVILKDINYILDNFPIENLVNLEEPLKKVETERLQQIFDPAEDKNKLKKEKTVEEKKGKKFFKIKSISKKDILYVYKKIQSEMVYRIIGLLINLLYWIVFGFMNRIQVDRNTKQHIFFNILQELQNVEHDFGNIKMFNKIFMPILILIIRIECEAIFHKKFKMLFENKYTLHKALERMNEVITIIFDPNNYYNTFSLLSHDATQMKHKVSKKLYPNYKSKIHATSNLLNQLFNNFTNLNNKKIFKTEKQENLFELSEPGK